MTDFIHERQAIIGNRFRVLQDAVTRLDDNHDKSWTDDGQPSLEAVQAMTGLADISREELNKFGRVRVVPDTTRLPEKMNGSGPTPDEAAAAFDEADVVLAEARERLRVASLAVRTTRDALDRAKSAWLRQFSVTAEENARQFIASSLETRAKLASGEIQPAARPRPAASRIDEMNSGVRQRGYGPGYRRGAYDRSQYGVRVKFESQK